MSQLGVSGMKRICLFSICLCLILCGCSHDRAAESYSEYSGRMCGFDRISVSANVRAEYESTRSDFSLCCLTRGDEHEICVLEPECIKGVTAILHGREAELQFNSVIIAAPLLDKNGLSPVTALPVFIDALRYGFLEACRTENELYFWQIIIDDNTTAQVYFDPVADMPTSAELICSGRTAIYLDITDWNGETDERFTEENMG